MFYLDFLERLHDRFRPRTYLEIGVERGFSLARSRCRSIGVDPDFRVDQEVLAPTSLVRATSEQFFARLEATGVGPFGPLPVDLAYIDGMHLFEYALADFIGTERLASAASVIAFDDILPRSVDEAARQRHTVEWTGDVFRVVDALRTHRPGLSLLRVETEPTGTLIVTGLDPDDRTLSDQFEEIVREHVRPDPQPIPPEVAERTGLVAPEEALALPFWDELRELRG